MKNGKKKIEGFIELIEEYTKLDTEIKMKNPAMDLLILKMLNEIVQEIKKNEDFACEKNEDFLREKYLYILNVMTSYQKNVMHFADRDSLLDSCDKAIRYLANSQKKINQKTEKMKIEKIERGIS